MVVLGGCGRFHFADLADATPGDDVVDVGPPCAPFDVTLPTQFLDSEPPIVWTGVDYIVVATSTGNYVAQHVAIDGTFGAADLIAAMSIGDLGVGPTAIAWSGTILGLVLASPVATFLSYDPVSRAVSGPIVVDTVDGAVARIVWTGDRFGVASQVAGAFRIVEVDATGAPLAAPVIFTEPVTSFASMAFDGASYLLPFGTTSNGTELLNATYSPPTSTTYDVDAGASGIGLTFARGPGGFAVIVDNGNSPGVNVLDSLGNSMSGTTLLPTPAAAFATITGRASGYHIDAIDGTDVESMDVDPTGTMFSQPTVLFTLVPSSYTVPSALDAPGRHLIALAYNTMANGNVVRMIQQCI